MTDAVGYAISFITQNVATIATTIAGLGVIFGAAASIFKWIIPTVNALINHVKLTQIIADEFRPNGGSSLKDGIDRIESELGDLKTGMEESKADRTSLHVSMENISTQLTQHSARQWAIASTSSEPLFETDDKGACSRINVSYKNLVERDAEDLRNAGWENILHPKDHDRVTTSFAEAVEKKRSWEQSFKIIAAQTKKMYEVDCIASPFFEGGTGKLIGYIGKYVSVQSIESPPKRTRLRAKKTN